MSSPTHGNPLLAYQCSSIAYEAGLSSHVQAAGHEDKEGSPQPPPAQAHHIGVGHFEQLRNTPYNTEGWQPPQHLQAHLQHHMVAGPTDWPSAFAPTHRCGLSKAIQ